MRVKPFALLSLSICLTILSIVLIIKLHDQDLIYNLLVLNLSREMTIFHKWGGSGRETVCPGRARSVKDALKPRWQVFWRKINGGKKKALKASLVTPVQASYDPDEYSQNFDRGTDWTKPEDISRSFSARFADPSRVLQKSNTVR